jgi:hypothetical protein
MQVSDVGVRRLKCARVRHKVFAESCAFVLNKICFKITENCAVAHRSKKQKIMRKNYPGVALFLHFFGRLIFLARTTYFPHDVRLIFRTTYDLL